MSIAKSTLEQEVKLSFPKKDNLPTMYDLPSEEESGLPDEFHLLQSEFCSATFVPNVAQNKVFVASDLNLYYDWQNSQWYKRPDWFAVVGVDRLYQGNSLRLSYVMWQEEVAPSIAIEFLSPSTRNEDLGKSKRKGKQPTKWEVYEQILRIPYYFVFDGVTNKLLAYELVGNRYSPLELTDSKVWIPNLSIGLGLWQGEYRGCTRQWLRWYDAEGDWIPTEAERERIEKGRERMAKELALQETERERMAKELALQETERERIEKELALQEKERERMEKELALQERDQAQQKIEELLERLREAGINPRDK